MEVKNIFNVIIEYGVPLIAIMISIASFHESKKVAKVQLRLSQMEELLKKYELEEKEKERAKSIEAVIEARIYNISKGKYKLKIWNSGQAEAYDVDFQVPDEAKKIVFRDKVPFEVLEPRKSFEEHIIVHMGMPQKFYVKTTWRDLNGESYEKDQIVTI